MSTLQKGLLSIALMVVFGTLIYVLIVWYKKTKNKMRKNDMLTLNLVVKYKVFLNYLDFQIKNNDKFDLFLVSINNLDLLANKNDNSLTRTYLRRVAKDLSVYLPYGGKLAQTNLRNIFILYVPVTGESEHIYALQLKEQAERVFYKQNNIIQKNASIAYLSGLNYKSTSDLMLLKIGVINSKRNLGEVIECSVDAPTQYNEYTNVLERLKSTKVVINLLEVLSPIATNNHEIYASMMINDYKIAEFINSISLLEQTWVNMWIVEMLLNKLYDNNVKSSINLPILLKTLESSNFIDYLQSILASNQYLMEQLVISLKIVNVNDENQIIKNILGLINMGVKISLDINQITPEIFIIINKFNINRLEINDTMLESSEVAELLYFAKVNNLEVLLKTTEVTIDNARTLNVSHITKFKTTLKVDGPATKKRGRR